MSEEQAKSGDRFQFTIGMLLAVTTAVGLVISVILHSDPHSSPLSPFILGGVLMFVGIFVRKTRLVEWGGAIVLIGLPIHYLWPRTSVARPAARRHTCSSNVKQIAVALHNHHDTYRTFPARNHLLSDGTRGLSWRVTVLPFMEHRPLHNRFRLDEVWNSPHNLPLAAERPEFFACPSAKRRLKEESDYYAIGGPDSCLPDGRPINMAKVTDGTSNVLLVVESHTFHATWSEPRDLDPATMRWGINGRTGVSSGHPGGANVAMGDASVRFLTNRVDPAVLKQLANRHDQQPAADWNGTP